MVALYTPFRLRQFVTLFIIMLLAFSMTACKRNGPGPAPSVAPTKSAATPGVILTPTAELPTATTAPLAALVNGEGITLAEYQAELGRFQAAQATPEPGKSAPDGKKQVLDNLIDQLLLEQGAKEAGYVMDDAGLQARMDQLSASLGSPQALIEAYAALGYSDQDFRQALKRETAAAWMRDKIISAVPDKADQVHARQILLYNSDEANQILARIQSGTDFASLAAQIDPVKSGDLGWFPQGYLDEPALDQAAFSLQPGAHSSVIQTRLGFHILQVIERDPQHPLDPDARRFLQLRALTDWLEKRRSQSNIQVFTP